MTLRSALVAVVLASTGLAAAAGQPLRSGLDLAGVDTSYRPQDDLFRFVNGRWLATVDIPPNRVMYGTFMEMAEKTDVALKRIIEDAAATPRWRRTPRTQQIGDLYTSFMDEDGIEALGVAPLRRELAKIDAIRTASEFAAEAGALAATAAGGPFGATVAADGERPDRLIVQVSQGGTRLPTRDYYLQLDPVFVEARSKYEAYLTTVFTLVGRSDAARAARDVMNVETAIARVSYTPLESRAALQTVRRTTLDELASAMPGFDWRAWAAPQGFERAWRLVLLQPTFFKNFAVLVPIMPLEAWKAWLASRYIFAASPYLSRPFIDSRFEFVGRALSGQQELTPRWMGGVGVVNTYLGDVLGQLYVEKSLSPRAQEKAAQIVTNVIRAYKQSLSNTAWLTRDTRNEALAKLAKMTPLVGAPRSWRDYSDLVITPDDVVGNWQRAITFTNTDRLSRVRGASDQGGWLISTQSINAYYNPATNEIVLTAAMLQPPIFDVDADDAVNYGALGATIGHEISHAFDERGRRFDASGDLRSWWTSGDEQEYNRRARGLVEMFSAFSPAETLRVNGELTLPENLADLIGLSVAHRAYVLSRNGKPAPVIDGFTGEQRFFLSYARMWRMKVQPDYLRQWLLTFQYAPEEFRTNGTVSHLQAFYDAFHVTAGDKLFRAPEDRVSVW